MIFDDPGVYSVIRWQRSPSALGHRNSFVSRSGGRTIDGRLHVLRAGSRWAPLGAGVWRIEPCAFLLNAANPDEPARSDPPGGQPALYGFAMKQYFFNVYDGKAYRDNVGMFLPDIASVQREAATMVGDLLFSGKAQMWNGENWHMEVVDSAEDLQFIIRFSASMATVKAG
jgi:hypothetical protein